MELFIAIVAAFGLLAIAAKMRGGHDRRDRVVRGFGQRDDLDLSIVKPLYPDSPGARLRSIEKSVEAGRPVISERRPDPEEMPIPLKPWRNRRLLDGGAKPRGRTSVEPPRDLLPVPSRSGEGFNIEYVDADGVITERSIDIIDVKMEGRVIHIVAFCHMRSDERTFRADRIMRLVDRRGQKLVDDPVAYFRKRVDPDTIIPEGHQAVMSRATPGINALLWIARSDYQLVNPEIAVMLDYIEARRMLPASRGEHLQWSRKHADASLRQMRPTYDMAAGGLTEIRRGGPEEELIITFIEKLVASGGADAAAMRKRADRLLKVMARK